MSIQQTSPSVSLEAIRWEMGLKDKQAKVWTVEVLSCKPRHRSKHGDNKNKLKHQDFLESRGTDLLLKKKNNW